MSGLNTNGKIAGHHAWLVIIDLEILLLIFINSIFFNQATTPSSKESYDRSMVNKGIVNIVAFARY